MAVRAACCMTCRRAKRRRRDEVVMCSIDGRRLRQKVGDPRAKCEHWPDGLGRVRWRGLLWRGLPGPRRWRLEARGYPGVMDLPGCGCIDRLKALWSDVDETWDFELIGRRLSAWLKRLVVGETPPRRSSGPR
jgi:hypothetical protein